MDAKELRIDNWVCSQGKDIKIKAPHIQYLLDEDNRAKPITLTEEWLVKFGFKKVKRQNVIQYENEYSLSHEFNQDGIFEFHIDDGTWIACKYVHKLQNLYFALTGEELEIET